MFGLSVSLLDALPSSESVRLARGLLDTFTDRLLWEPGDVVTVGLGDCDVVRYNDVPVLSGSENVNSDSLPSSDVFQALPPAIVVSPPGGAADPLSDWLNEEPMYPIVGPNYCPSFSLASPRRVMEGWESAERWEMGTPRPRGSTSATASPFATYDPVWSPAASSGMQGWAVAALPPLSFSPPASTSTMYMNDRDMGREQFRSPIPYEYGRLPMRGRSGATLSGGNLCGSSGSLSLAPSASPAGLNGDVGPDLSWRPPGGGSRWG